jgi:hypothetical protein
VVQWELVNRQGTPVRFDEPVALRCRDDYLRYGRREIMHNAEGEPLIYFQREIGGNIGWPSSRTPVDQGFGWAKDARAEGHRRVPQKRGGREVVRQSSHPCRPPAAARPLAVNRQQRPITPAGHAGVTGSSAIRTPRP